MTTLQLIVKTKGAIESLYNPEEYKGARKVYNDEEIIDKLTKYKNR